LKPPLLVTTALEDTVVANDEIVLLGEWCKLYRDRLKWRHIRHEVLAFHWDHAGKREFDYDYLYGVYEKVLLELVMALNDFHDTRYDRRCWEIILGTWLVSYVSALFDRWESLRGAFERYGSLRSVLLELNGNYRPPFGSLEQIEQCVDDRYNYELYLDIIRAEYPDRCALIPVRPSSIEPNYLYSPKHARTTGFRYLARRIAAQLVGACAELLPRPRIVFVTSYFPPGALLRLNLMFGQLPTRSRLLDTPLDNGDIRHGDTAFRAALDARLSSIAPSVADNRGRFETFLRTRVARDIPWLYLEGYSELRAQARDLRNRRCHTIVTAGSIWHDELFKAWAAEQVHEGSKLIVCEHGGSFPARQYIFSKDESISDWYVPTYLEHHPKHKQLPPTKYVSARPVGQHVPRYLTLVGFDVPRYVIRASSQPHATQALDCMEDSLRLIRGLPPEIVQHVRIKPHVAHSVFGWELRARYVDRLGAEAVLPDMPLSKAFTLSRVIVCTYPQSTFTEAMLTGLPTVLFFDPKLHGLHPVADACVRTLQRAEIVFFDPAEAAHHIANIWTNPTSWWRSAAVQSARAEFLTASMNLQPRPLLQWSEFLRAL
jgi:putative transferase (TIGR04331 family)